MKIKSLIKRNLIVNGQHEKMGGMPFSITLIAESTLDLSDADYKKVQKQIEVLVEKKVVEVVEEKVEEEVVKSPTKAATTKTAAKK